MSENKIIGYTFSGGSSNEGIFFNDAPAGVLCPSCGTCLDYRYAPQIINIHPSKKYDISYTHDLRTLFSERFVDFCKNTLRVAEEFKPIQAGKMIYYYMMPSKILEFDAERRKTKFQGLCNVCGGYHSVAGATPSLLKQRTEVDNGFFRTDLAFADGKSKNPLLILSNEWKELMQAQKFRGLVFHPIGSEAIIR